ncbi:putative retrotransposon protein [Tanacetum coccineum]
MGYAPVQAPPFAPKPKNPPTPKKDNPAKDVIYHQCGEVGHWRRNCPIYLSELMKKKKLSQGAGTSGIFTIELYSFPSTSWVYDTGCGTHICITSQGLKGSRELKSGALSLYVGDGHRAAVEAIGDYHLTKLNLDYALLWHCHLGHINKKRKEKLQHDGLLNSTDIKSFEKCVACMSRKMARKPYSHQVERAKDLLRLIHTDVCGPFNIMSRQGAYYLVTFTDDFSRYGYVYVLKHKHEVFETFKVFQKEVENQLGKTIKSLRFDRVGEYTSQEFLDHLKDHGIIAHRTPPYTPQHNEVSERRNRTLLDMVRSMMTQTTLPKSFWDYALESVARILNMVPTKKVDKTPYEIWHKTIGYSFYYPPENKIFVARNAEFLENSLINHEASGSLKDLEIIQDEDTHPSLDTSLNHEENDQEIDEPQSDINPIRRSTRTRRPTDRLCLYVDAEEHKLRDLGEPANYKAALLDPESDKWLNAMNVEMQSMKDNKVWELVDLPPDAKIIGHKWLFKKKTDMDGAVHIYKARLVAKGFTQTLGIDYEETFSPVADIRAIRILIAIAAFYDYEIWQMDVKTAFLNGYLSEEVYMEQPEGFVSQKFPNRTAVKNILKYLRNTKDMFLVYEGDMKRELMVSCYTDAGYLTDVDDMNSQTGYVFVLNGGVVDWKSTKQSIFATSSTDAEYIAACDASKEVVWIRKFIYGLGVVPTIEEPINMYCDNTGAIAIAKDHGVTKGARHFRAKVHYLRETIEMGDARIEKVDTYDNLADPFTKALAFPKHSELTEKIGMIPASSLMKASSSIDLCSVARLGEHNLAAVKGTMDVKLESRFPSLLVVLKSSRARNLSVLNGLQPVVRILASLKQKEWSLESFESDSVAYFHKA